MTRLGLLLESERKLDYVLGLTTAKIMERRLLGLGHGNGVALTASLKGPLKGSLKGP